MFTVSKDTPGFKGNHRNDHKTKRRKEVRNLNTSIQFKVSEKLHI